MRLLVTGCYGFLGYHLTRLLLEQGHHVLGVDRIRNARSRKDERIDRANFPFEECDLCDYKRLFRLVARYKPSVIVHIAAQYSVPYTTENLHRYLRSNCAAFCYVFEAAKLAGVRRVVYASSIAVSDSRTPRGLYGATKGFGELAAHAYSNRGVHSTGLRYGVVYGPMLREDTGIYRVLTDQLTGRASKLSSDHKSKRCYIEVNDAARCTAKFIASPMQSAHEVYTLVADDYKADLGDVAIAGARYLGRRPVVPDGYQQRKAGHAPAPLIEHVRAAIGDYPATTLDDGIGAVMQWLSEKKKR